MDSMEELIRKLTKALLELSEVEKKKLEAIRTGKVLEVEECMKSEQVYTMQFRALEKKTDELLAAEGFSGMSLSSIIEKQSGKRRDTLEALFEELQKALTDFRCYHDAAQELLKTQLYKMEKKLQEDVEKSSIASGKQEHSFHPRKA